MSKEGFSKNKSGVIKLINTIGWGLFITWAAGKVYRQLTRKSLKGMVVLVTGGARGLGLCMARELGSRGARLALCSRTSEQLNQAKEELEQKGYEVLTIVTDITRPEQVTSMMDKIVDHYGTIDILINNAGMMIVGPENVMAVEDYKTVMEANVWGALHTIKATLPHFKHRHSGHIVNITSIGGRIAVPHMLPYSVSKFAMTGLSQGLATELRKENIIVTTVTPNLMRTGSPRNITVKGDHEKEYAWFKISDSLPLLSQSPVSAAKRIVEGICLGEREITLTLTAKIAVAVQALLPGIVRNSATIANHFLPSSEHDFSRKGSESESAITKGSIGGITDAAAAENNEI
jgi:short-subunit dehydrogenase